MKIEEFARLFEKYYPKQLAENWDNTGILINSEEEFNLVLVCIDITESVIDEAINKKCKAILSYHPTLFKSFKKLVPETRSQKLALRLLKNGISVYSPHSALDSVNGGINDWLASLVLNEPVSLTSVPKNTTAIEPSQSDISIGSGRYVTYDTPITIDEFIDRIKNGLDVPLRYAIPSTKKEIKTVAICCGSGSMMFANKCADAVITGEMGHHEVLEHLEWNTAVVLSEHTNTERGYLKHWIPRLSELFPSVTFYQSECDVSPLVYMV
ncbi:dinuclear metal center protein, YbgI/SA1388 family protein [Entamoeba histolytica HM-1:IMSS-B]|uniref:NGG1-interacting factor 3, putative n=6 Tax=Entamoeba histolytica TaxID=5759 RepID=C4M6M9_ENTH1|nr:NGG1-interacting factor 3, putative [Entamoeba histolytica HM-1:IMSS]EMD48838.1 NGG1interacting factor 3, putative [Entamoeba histolytica KU27]EMH76054.1 dinuclear metal center protein, YbgI/SA1388 family protein [Entamoeba histolytica HM-1:IMSS-B]EMS16737.1 NGG1-interacting factor 3, putative [Entamoeba histolytica HM-3:IMSS]ENY64591.1 NGG1-interacting factor 3, putative [Entamoeba histolytica HM-1:IMSS-A]GAT97149.1 ngg1-interacting factor 3 putative [Entamoeba histolytica]|eukprot:XP_649305.1 NGG1-interacting factor 3, putative [Entamoeba histolytica HM-1:IMSS]